MRCEASELSGLYAQGAQSQDGYLALVRKWRFVVLKDEKPKIITKQNSPISSTCSKKHMTKLTFVANCGQRYGVKIEISHGPTYADSSHPSPHWHRHSAIWTHLSYRAKGPSMNPRNIFHDAVLTFFLHFFFAFTEKLHERMLTPLPLKEMFDEMDRERATPEGKRLIHKAKKKDEKKGRKRIGKRKKAVIGRIHEWSTQTGLPTVLINLVDHYLHARCVSCSAPISPAELNDWNCSFSNDNTFSTSSNPCSRYKPNSHHLRSEKCLMNKWVRVNNFEGGPSWLMHIDAFKMDYGNYMAWTIVLCKESSVFPSRDATLAIHPFAKIRDVEKTKRQADRSEWSSITSCNRMTIETLRMIGMTDEEFQMAWRGKLEEGGGNRMISCVRAQLISNLENLFD